jgi:hypothetical protein
MNSRQMASFKNEVINELSAILSNNVVRQIQPKLNSLESTITSLRESSIADQQRMDSLEQEQKSSAEVARAEIRRSDAKRDSTDAKRDQQYEDIMKLLTSRGTDSDSGRKTAKRRRQSSKTLHSPFATTNPYGQVTVESEDDDEEENEEEEEDGSQEGEEDKGNETAMAIRSSSP